MSTSLHVPASKALSVDVSMTLRLASRGCNVLFECAAARAASRTSIAIRHWRSLSGRGEEGIFGHASDQKDKETSQTSVDLSPSIAATLAKAAVMAKARRTKPPSQVQVYRELAVERYKKECEVPVEGAEGGNSPSLQLQHDEDGVIRVVPKKKAVAAPRSMAPGSHHIYYTILPSQHCQPESSIATCNFCS